MSYSLTNYQDADNLDFEGLLTKVLDKHAKAILSAFKFQLQHGITRSVFSAPGVVSLVSEGTYFSSFLYQNCPLNKPVTPSRCPSPPCPSLRG